VPDIPADKERIQQVLVNFLSNAIKYSPNGGDIIISLRQEGPAVIVAVRDPGLGIPAEELDKLFERFYRGSAAEELRIMGTGLGLALSREIIHLHRGRIWAESAGEGQGATFSFALPIARQHE
jgi:signal transduction histidine kinase